MLTFSFSGALGCVQTTAPDELTLAVASALDRSGTPPRIVWIVCIARDQTLRAASALRAGDQIRVDGHIEPRRRSVGERTFYSVAFIARTIERISAPTVAARVAGAIVLARAKGKRWRAALRASLDPRCARWPS